VKTPFRLFIASNAPIKSPSLSRSGQQSMLRVV
jgi:hypothetical protein